MRPSINIDVERREKLILRHYCKCDSDLPLLCAAASKDGNRIRCRRNGNSPSQAKNRTQRSLPLRFGQEIQTLPKRDNFLISSIIARLRTSSRADNLNPSVLQLECRNGDQLGWSTFETICANALRRSFERMMPSIAFEAFFSSGP